MSKRIISILLCICMVFGQLSLAALADTPDNFTTYDDIFTNNDQILEYGEKVQNENANNAEEFAPPEAITTEVVNSKISGTFRFMGQLITAHDSEATYYYDDAYFLQNSNIYNPMLATMSLCLESTAWASRETANWPDKSKNVRKLLTGATLLSPGVYQSGTSGIGFKQYAQNDAWNTAPTRDSIGVVAANKAIIDPGNNNKGYTLIALALRGSGYKQEWANNFTVGASGSHSGFTASSDKVLTFLKEYIVQHGITGDVKLWVVGFSRGAAVANMVGGTLDNGYSLPNVSLAHKDLFVYTFETPQGALTTNIAGSGKDYSNIHNIINLNDPIPLVAPYPWKFTRYGEDQRLPSAYTSSTFSTQRAAMLTEFYKFEGASVVGYKVQESSTKQNFKVDRSKWLPGGDPLWWFENSEVSQREVLVDTMDFLANDIFISRSNYYTNFQNSIREIFGVLNDGSGKMELFIERFASRLDFNTILGFLTPMLSLNPFKSFNTRLNEVGNKVQDFVKVQSRIIAAEVGINVTDLFINSLSKLMRDLIVNTARDVWNNNTNSVNLVVKLVDLTLSGSVPQAHYPEICFAWMMSRDPNYTGTTGTTGTTTSATSILPDKIIAAAYRILRINCPVDVSIYDSENNLVAAIIEDVPQDVDSSIVNYLNHNGEKMIYLPADDYYQIAINATDDGELSYSIGEYDLNEGALSRLTNYYNIPIRTGDSFIGTVGSFDVSEIENGIPNGSAVSYQLLNSSTMEVLSSEEISGSAIQDNYFKVTIVTDNNSGYADGAGTFIKGSYAQLTAMPLSGSSLIGWYVNGNLVSTNPVYRFVVTDDILVTAKFVPVEIHELKVSSGVGGKVTSAEGYYTIGTEIAIVAEAESGYRFKNWTSSDGGLFDYVNNATTTFMMPDNGVTIMATFEAGDVDDDNFNGDNTEDNGNGNEGNGGDTGNIGSEGENNSDNTVDNADNKIIENDENDNNTVNNENDNNTVNNENDDPSEGDGNSSNKDDDNTGNNSTDTSGENNPDNKTGNSENGNATSSNSDNRSGTGTNSGNGGGSNNGNTLNSGNDALSDEPADSDAISFETNGDNSGDNQQASPDSTFVLPENPEKEDFTFAGWYTDVNASDWYYEAVQFLASKGITQGVSSTSFDPDGKVTRAQFIVMLCRAYNIEERTGDNFSDAGNTWYTGALAAAKQLGISQGIGDDKFAPDDEITREEMVVMLYNYLSLTEPAPDAMLTDSSAAYSDEDLISPWAREGVLYATTQQWVNGKEGNTFDPLGTATRAELAQLFYNLLRRLSY